MANPDETPKRRNWLPWLVPSPGALAAVLACWLLIPTIDPETGSTRETWMPGIASARTGTTDLSPKLAEHAGIALTAALLMAGCAYLVYWTSLRFGVGPILSMVSAAYSLTLLVLWKPTIPYLWTLFLLGVWLIVLLRHRQSGSWRWLPILPATTALWIFLHDGHPLGLGLTGLFLLDAVLDLKEKGTPRPRLRMFSLVGAIALSVGVAVAFTNVDPRPILPVFTGSSPETGWSILGAVLVTLLLGMSGRTRVYFLGRILILAGIVGSLLSTAAIPLFAVLGLPYLAKWTFETLTIVGMTSDSIAGKLAGGLQKLEDRMKVWEELARPAVPAALLAIVVALSV